MQQRLQFCFRFWGIARIAGRAAPQRQTRHCIGGLEAVAPSRVASRPCGCAYQLACARLPILQTFLGSSIIVSTVFVIVVSQFDPQQKQGVAVLLRIDLLEHFGRSLTKFHINPIIGKRWDYVARHPLRALSVKHRSRGHSFAVRRQYPGKRRSLMNAPNNAILDHDDGDVFTMICRV